MRTGRLDGYQKGNNEEKKGKGRQMTLFLSINQFSPASLIFLKLLVNIGVVLSVYSCLCIVPVSCLCFSSLFTLTSIG